MRIAIMGAGAVGGYFGGVLANHGEDVVLIARGAHGEAISKNGLRVDSYWGSFNVKVDVTDDPSSVGTVDLVLHCTKLYSNAEALPSIKGMIGDDTTILTIQNGVTSGAVVAGYYGWDHVLQGATYIESGIAGPGRIHQSGSVARIEFGENDGSSTARTVAIREIFDKPGIQIEVSSNIVDTLWSKLVSVGSIGTLMTAARASLPEILASPHGEETVRMLMEEIVAVGQSQGVTFPPRCVESKLAGAKAEAGEFQSSLQYDLSIGKPLELDDLLGAVVKIASEANIPVPASAALVTVLDRFKQGSVDPASV
ncbi:MAG: 2-dehydropantoate 2-reductase [Chloroflexi bacterium]|nr:2-dehydropantoate 2-reductase [Chloroflexota bacterium]MCH8911478.1 2-dehydropantoate 2-reductase [Chloroflexota bacterium]